MSVVLLKNKSREILVLNIGDLDVEVSRTVGAQTKSGSVGQKTVTKRVSSSVTLLPGEARQVPGVALKQRAVQRLRDKGDLLVVKQESAGTAPKARPVKITAADPVVSGGASVEEEGSSKRKSRREIGRGE